MLASYVRPTPMTDRLYEYVLSVGVREPAAFEALRADTAQLPECEWQIAPEQGPFLAMLVQLMGAKKCLEVGTFTGYSAMWVAGALRPTASWSAAKSAGCTRAWRGSTSPPPG